MDGAAIAQQIMDARDLAAAGQPTSALVYFEALLPQLLRRVVHRGLMRAQRALAELEGRERRMRDAHRLSGGWRKPLQLSHGCCVSARSQHSA